MSQVPRANPTDTAELIKIESMVLFDNAVIKKRALS